MTSLALIVGIWTTSCTQTQSNFGQGFARDTYSFEENGEFEFRRDWYKDSNCTEIKDEEVSVGSVELGNRMSGMFVTGETYEANFSEASGTDLGAISVKGNSLKIARGMKNSTMRNTMVGFIEFVKQ